MDEAGLRVRVGIVSWNTAGLLDRCLAALPAALGALDASVVVVDNASTDATESVVAAHRFAEFRANHSNLGYARAMNQALSGNDSEVLIALNPDTEPPPGSLEALAHRLMDQADVGLVAPRLVNTDGSLQHSAYTFPSLHQAAAVSLLPRRLQAGWVGRRLWLEGHADHLTSADIDWCIGAVHVIRAEAVAGEQPYSERWFMYVEDLELCWRLHKRGWRRRLEADIQVPHVGSASADQAWDLTPPERWTPASYDWFARAYGPGRMRLWAGINAAGVAAHAIGGVAAELMERRSPRGRFRRELPLLAMHARAVWKPPGADSLGPPAR
jgi:GT2 family glycosyltransferase